MKLINNLKETNIYCLTHRSYFGDKEDDITSEEVLFKSLDDAVKVLNINIKEYKGYKTFMMDNDYIIDNNIPEITESCANGYINHCGSLSITLRGKKLPEDSFYYHIIPYEEMFILSKLSIY